MKFEDIELESDCVEYLRQNMSYSNLRELLPLGIKKFEALAESQKKVSKNSNLYKIVVQVEYLRKLGFKDINGILFDTIDDDRVVLDILEKKIDIKSNFFILCKLQKILHYINCDF